MEHLSISNDKEVVLLYYFDFIPPPFFFPKYIFFSDVEVFFLQMKRIDIIEDYANFSAFYWNNGRLMQGGT